jgi:hypothetical protein
MTCANRMNQCENRIWRSFPFFHDGAVSQNRKVMAKMGISNILLALTVAVAILGPVESFGVVPNSFRERSLSPSSTRMNSNSFKCAAEHEASTTVSSMPPAITSSSVLKGIERVALSAFLMAAISISSPFAAHAAGGSGAELAGNAKITTGGASTLQSGRTITITRGVNLDRSDFHGQNLKGVAFQQSIVRDSNFKDCNLVGSSFFDATIDGSDFENADMSQANIEMAQFKRANLHNTVMREVYVSGSTLFEGIKDIEGSDWTDTFRKFS